MSEAVNGETKKEFHKPKAPRPKSKLVIRRLPPNLPEDIFFKSIEQWQQSIKWSQYFPGKVSSTLSKDTRFSRAYVVFYDSNELLEFYKSFNGHVYADSKGNKYQAIIEFSPFQRYPSSSKTRIDERMNTIEAGFQRIIR